MHLPGILPVIAIAVLVAAGAVPYASYNARREKVLCSSCGDAAGMHDYLGVQPGHETDPSSFNHLCHQLHEVRGEHGMIRRLRCACTLSQADVWSNRARESAPSNV